MSTHRPGAIVWREHLTADLARSTAFYTELFGWKTKDSDMGPMGTYRLFYAGETQVAGSMQLGADMKGVPTCWVQYISVPDVDAAAAKVTATGGKVMMGPMDIPNIGRFVMITDPQGAAVALYKDAKGDQTPAGPPAPGTFCWESLNTTDKKAACAFYAGLAPYQIKDFHGNITLAIDETPSGGIGDVSDVPPGVPPHWLSHVVVANLAESRARAVALGGTVMMAEIDIPETGKMGVITDPLGAPLSLFQFGPAR
jgi:uncharacterized protein